MRRAESTLAMPSLMVHRASQPTLNPDGSTWRDLVIFDRISPRIGRQFERGDVVSLWYVWLVHRRDLSSRHRSPSDPGRMLVKRVLASEGDVVRTLPPYPDAEAVVPPGHVWVEGDLDVVSLPTSILIFPPR